MKNVFNIWTVPQLVLCESGGCTYRIRYGISQVTEGASPILEYFDLESEAIEWIRNNVQD